REEVHPNGRVADLCGERASADVGLSIFLLRVMDHSGEVSRQVRGNDQELRGHCCVGLYPLVLDASGSAVLAGLSRSREAACLPLHSELGVVRMAGHFGSLGSSVVVWSDRGQT